MAMSINNAPLSPNHPYFFRQNCSVQGGAAAGPMRILFLPTKMCHPQCRDEERCAENHSNDHNFALETIQMPSFWEYIRLDVLHVPGVATRVMMKEHERTQRARRAAPAPAPRPFLAFIRRFKHSDYDSDVEDIETDIWPKAGHLNRLQCKVTTSNVSSTSVDEGAQPRERRSHPAERRSTSSDGVMGDPSSDQNDRERTPPGNDTPHLEFLSFFLDISGGNYGSSHSM